MLVFSLTPSLCAWPASQSTGCPTSISISWDQERQISSLTSSLILCLSLTSQKVTCQAHLKFSWLGGRVRRLSHSQSLQLSSHCVYKPTISSRSRSFFSSFFCFPSSQILLTNLLPSSVSLFHFFCFQTNISVQYCLFFFFFLPVCSDQMNWFISINPSNTPIQINALSPQRFTTDTYPKCLFYFQSSTFFETINRHHDSIFLCFFSFVFVPIQKKKHPTQIHSTHCARSHWTPKLEETLMVVSAIQIEHCNFNTYIL